MNKKLGYLSSLILALCVILFAVFMIFLPDAYSYLVCIFLSWAYVVLACCYFIYNHKSAAALAGVAFACMYAVIIDIVYFTQLTTVMHETASADVISALSYAFLGSWMFNLDLFGYGLMALSTLMIGLTLNVTTRKGKWLRNLLLIHGVFVISCTLIPMLNLFSKDMMGGDFIGVAVLVFWCAFFTPIALLSSHYFNRDGHI
jgi:hypothetical protein